MVYTFQILQSFDLYWLIEKYVINEILLKYLWKKKIPTLSAYVRATNGTMPLSVVNAADEGKAAFIMTFSGHLFQRGWALRLKNEN